MTFHSQFAFVETCSNPPRQRNHPQCHRSKQTHWKTALSSMDSSMVDGSATSTQVIPTANFDTTSNFEPVVFEPILNVPALITFVLITTVFSALILRTNQVEDAVQLRKKMQEQVRTLKAKEIGEGQVPPEELQKTLQLYEDAVRNEEKLRNILPGVRIVPPSSSDRREEEAQAIAKQYLGDDFNIGVPKRYNEKREDGSLPGVAIGVLALVALSQVGLLAFFNFGADPMIGNGAFM